MLTTDSVITISTMYHLTQINFESVNGKTIRPTFSKAVPNIKNTIK